MYALIAKVIRISRAKFRCNRLTAVQDIQDYASLIFWDTVYVRRKRLILSVPLSRFMSSANIGSPCVSQQAEWA